MKHIIMFLFAILAFNLHTEDVDKSSFSIKIYKKYYELHIGMSYQIEIQIINTSNNNVSFLLKDENLLCFLDERTVSIGSNKYAILGGKPQIHIPSILEVKSSNIKVDKNGKRLLEESANRKVEIMANSYITRTVLLHVPNEYPEGESTLHVFFEVLNFNSIPATTSIDVNVKKGNNGNIHQ